jgi:hypothetical protein
MQETSRIDTPLTPAPSADSPTLGPTDSPVAAKKGHQPGKLPPVPQANHADSRAAAADVLSKLLKQQKR